MGLPHRYGDGKQVIFSKFVRNMADSLEVSSITGLVSFKIDAIPKEHLVSSSAFLPSCRRLTAVPSCRLEFARASTTGLCELLVYLPVSCRSESGSRMPCR